MISGTLPAGDPQYALSANYGMDKPGKIIAIGIAARSNEAISFHLAMEPGVVDYGEVGASGA